MVFDSRGRQKKTIKTIKNWISSPVCSMIVAVASVTKVSSIHRCPVTSHRCKRANSTKCRCDSPLCGSLLHCDHLFSFGNATGAPLYRLSLAFPMVGLFSVAQLSELGFFQCRSRGIYLAGLDLGHSHCMGRFAIMVGES